MKYLGHWGNEAVRQKKGRGGQQWFTVRVLGTMY